MFFGTRRWLSDTRSSFGLGGFFTKIIFVIFYRQNRTIQEVSKDVSLSVRSVQGGRK